MPKASAVQTEATRNEPVREKALRVANRAGAKDLGEVVDLLPGIVWTALPDGRIAFLNEGWRDYTGLSPAESCGWQWQSAVHPEDLPELLDRWWSIFDSKQPGEAEARLRGRNGAYRWFLIRARPVKDGGGQVIEWCGINTEIEDQRLALESRYARWWLSPAGREHHFREVGDRVAALFVLTSPAGEVQACNQHALDFFGVTPEEMKNRPIADTLHPDDRASVIETWERAVVTGGIYTTKARHLRKDGTYRWFNVRPLPLRDAEGRLVFWYFLQTDIDAQHRAEDLVAAENQLLEMVASGRPLGVVLDALCAAVDTTAEGCLANLLLIDGTNVREAVGPGLPPGFNRFLDGRPLTAEDGPHGLVASLKEQVITSDLATETRWKADGWVAHAHAHGFRSSWCTPITSLEGELLGVLAIHRRDTVGPEPFHVALMGQFSHIASIAIERTRSEQALGNIRTELARVSKITSLGALTASIAHEVNQPLAGIITNAGTCLRMLQAEPPNVQGAQETARRTIRDGQRASDVISRLRALFRNKGVANEAVDLNEATLEVVALSRSELQRSQVLLRHELTQGLPQVTGDRVQLQQVILNLLLNALEAVGGVDDRPRQLVIRTELAGAEVRLSVQDSGIGFPRQDADRLFEAFYTTKAGGMGIGLSVSRSIIERHGGRLRAEPNEGPGATFSFSIPRADRGRDRTSA